MLSSDIVLSTGILLLSFIVAILCTYYLINHSKNCKKLYIEESINQIINFTILIWCSKILINLPLFINEPLSVLAYPSNSNAFYCAFILTFILFIYKVKRKTLKVNKFIQIFIFIILTASFIYEFLQYQLSDDVYAFGYFILLSILLLIFIMIRGKMKISSQTLLLVSIWSVGLLILYYWQSIIIIFDYVIEPWFIFLFFITNLCFIWFIVRKEELDD